MGDSCRNIAKKRVVNACARCRHHKIKCTGDCPCSNCIQRKVKCKFEGEEAKIQITKKRLSELKRRNCELEKENRALQEQLLAHVNATPVAEHSSRPTSPIVHPSASASSSPRLMNEHEEDDTSMVNPLSHGPPKYITDIAGRPHYLGHTSNWSLTIRLLHLTHQALYKCPFPSAAHHIDSMTYDLQWNGLRSPIIPDIRGLPSLDQALFLINAAKFHTGQIFHLFDEPTFMAQLHHFYENPRENIHAKGVWFTHFLVIIALGKVFIGAKNRGTTPPGAEFFTPAFMMLPDYSFLWKDPFTSAELLCSMALYLQSIDWRVSAHNMISQALRILQVHGYHTNVSEFNDPKDLVRCQSIWWTVYILERQLSVLLGVPLGISDNDISTSLPNYPNSLIKTVTTAIHVKLSQAFSQVVNVLYRENGSLNSTLVKTTQEVLQRVANVASELRHYFPVPEQESMNGISRVSGYLNLLYHQCIMLATRPFLFGLVEKTCLILKDTGMEIPMAIQLLLQICLESAKKTVFILSSLQDQTLLECFLPFDLESAVSAGLVIIMTTLGCPSLIEDSSDFLNTLSTLLDQMIYKGNLIAAGQRTELNQLESLCTKLKSSTLGYSNSSGLSPVQDRMTIRPELTSVDLGLGLDQNGYMAGSEIEANVGRGSREDNPGQVNEPSGWVRDMTPSQLLEVVDLLNGDNLLDWVEFPSGVLEFGRDGVH
ncbi:fungal-specific transcription factor domain-containing protein [Aspergillus cavernicola]|uniref:Fungal-specific transcription factor domain-containing protein n=1 Tax=Aspergillus cavernicola TaxID=176166 RepID=A0ABR4HEP0_9EURO